MLKSPCDFLVIGVCSGRIARRPDLESYVICVPQAPEGKDAILERDVLGVFFMVGVGRCRSGAAEVVRCSAADVFEFAECEISS